MAKTRDINQLFDGVSGKIGQYIVKQVNGGMIVTKGISKYSKDHQYTEAQLERQRLFAKVSAWANKHKNDKEFVEAAAKDKNPYIRSYTIAMRTAFANPEIMEAEIEKD